MSVMNIGAGSFHRSRSAAILALSLKYLNEWWQRSRSRYELESLGEDGLRDIGLSSSEAKFEGSKPFWAA